MKNNFSTVFARRAVASVCENATLSAAWTGHADLGKITYAQYRKNLSDSAEAVSAIDAMMNAAGGFHLLAAQTGAGKTYAVAEAFRKNLTEESGDDFENRRNINILLLPSRSQTEQFSAEYKIRAVVSGVNISAEDADADQNFASVYDKADEFTAVLEHSGASFLACHRFNIVLDEAHLLVQAYSYRKEAVAKVRGLIEKVSAIGGNVIFTTATYQALTPFSFSDTLFCLKEKDEHIPDTHVISVPDGRREADAVYQEIRRLLTEGKIPYVRLNDKSLAEDIKANLAGDGKTTALINSDERAAGSEAVKTITDESVLPFADCYILTSMIDAGANLRGRKNADGKTETPENIVPVFVINSNNCNTDNIEQSFARLRFIIKEREILITKPTAAEDTRTLTETLSETCRMAEHLKNSFSGVLEFCGEESTAKMLAEITDTDRNTAENLLVIADGEVKIDETELFRLAREKEYMRRYTDADQMRQFCLEALGGAVYTEEQAAGTDKVQRETAAQRQEAFAEIAADADRVKKMAEHTGEDWKRFAETAQGKAFARMTEEGTDAAEAAEKAAAMTEKDAKKWLKESDRNIIASFSAAEVAYIAHRLGQESEGYGKADRKKAEQFFCTGYTADAEQAAAVGMQFAEFASAAAAAKTDAELKESIRTFQAKDINRRLAAKMPVAGAFAETQKAYIAAVKAELKGQKTLTVSAGSTASADIRAYVQKNRGAKSAIEEATMYRVLRRTFLFRENKSGSITVYGLRK